MPLSIRQREATGAPVVVGSTQVTPVMRQHLLRWGHGALLWRRPVALLVTTEGHTYRVPILNVTLRATCAAMAVGALFALAIRALASLGRRD